MATMTNKQHTTRITNFHKVYNKRKPSKLNLTQAELNAIVEPLEDMTDNDLNRIISNLNHIRDERLKDYGSPQEKEFAMECSKWSVQNCIRFSLVNGRRTYTEEEVKEAKGNIELTWTWIM